MPLLPKTNAAATMATLFFCICKTQGCATDTSKILQLKVLEISMTNGWTDERRARQAELIRSWKPWIQSTGPRTQEGKAKVSRNAYSGATWLRIRQLSVKVTRLIREMKAAGQWPPKLS
jgi:hypothetical protein